MYRKVRSHISALGGKLYRRLARWDRERPWVKFVLVALLIAVYTVGWGDKPIWEYLRLTQRESHLREQIGIYRPRLQADSLRLEQAKKLGSQIEEVARVEYLMKSPGEDIYIIK